MSAVSMLVVPAEKARARFIIETNGMWQDGDIGLKKEWIQTRDKIFDQFTAFLTVQKSLNQVWLRTECRSLYQCVIPEAAHKLLANAFAAAETDEPPVLNIFTYPMFDDIPWELLHDGTNYLGLRYRVARMPIVS